jgi:hypothetical protein
VIKVSSFNPVLAESKDPGTHWTYEPDKSPPNLHVAQIATLGWLEAMNGQEPELPSGCHPSRSSRAIGRGNRLQRQREQLDADFLRMNE